MITFEPVKVLFHAGGIPVYSYGFFLALSFLAGLTVALWQGGKGGLDPVHMLAVVGMIVLGSMAGSRSYYVLEHIGEFAGRPATHAPDRRYRHYRPCDPEGGKSTGIYHGSRE